MCLMPASGRSRISSVTSTPPLTLLRVAVPLTPDSRLGVRSTYMVCSSCAPALTDRATARAANIATTSAVPLSLLARYIILLRYYPPDVVRSSRTPQMQVLAPSSVVGSSPARQTIASSRSLKTDILRRCGRLVVFAQHFVGPPQVSGGSIQVAVVRLEIRLGGGGGVCRQAVS
jgi:hypothetical protein